MDIRRFRDINNYIFPRIDSWSYDCITYHKWYIDCNLDSVLNKTEIVIFRMKKPYGAMY
jgi:hypothetical protein